MSIGKQFTQQRSLFSQHLGQHRVRRIANEHRSAGQQLKQRCSQRIDIRAVIDRITGRSRLFGAHVIGRAQHRAGHTHPHIVKTSGQTKIG